MKLSQNIMKACLTIATILTVNCGVWASVTLSQGTVEAHSATINITATGNPTSLVVKYCATEDGDYINFGTLSGEAESVTVSGLSANTQYYFKVTATFSAGDPVTSSALSIRTLASDDCIMSSTEKEVTDELVGGACTFATPWEIKVITDSEREEITVRYRYTQAQALSTGPYLFSKPDRSVSTGAVEYSDLTWTPESDNWYSSAAIPLTTLHKEIGDEIYLSVKAVPATNCSGNTEENRYFYATKFLAYTIGDGCSETQDVTFSKRLIGQKNLYLQTKDGIIRKYQILNADGSEVIKTVTASDTDYISTSIKDLELGTYILRIFDANGKTGLKVMHTVY